MESGALGSNTRSVSYQLWELEQVSKPVSSSAEQHPLATTCCIFGNVGHISKQNSKNLSPTGFASVWEEMAIHAEHKTHMSDAVIRAAGD